MSNTAHQLYYKVTWLMTLPLNTDPPIRLLAGFQNNYPQISPEYILQAPGRDMWVVAAVNDSHEFDLTAVDFDGRAAFSYQSAKVKQTVMRRPLPDWARYPAGVMIQLHNRGMDVSGIVAAVGGGEPPGPRYDYGLGIVIAALWHEICDEAYTANDLIAIVDHVRRDYIEQED